MIVTRSEREIDKIRESGRITAEALEVVAKEIRVGIDTKYLDTIAEEYIRSQGGAPSFLNYVPAGMKGVKPFPATLCISINEEVVHGIPSTKKIIQDGDIVSVDCGVFKNGYHADSARTYLVGNVKEEVKKLVEVTEKSMWLGIAEAIVGKKLYDISGAIQEYTESFGYGVVDSMVGHGIGTRLHEEPPVPNIGRKNTGMFLREGLVLAIEPMINLGGKRKVKVAKDNWTIITEDGKPSAHFEHTVVIRKGQAEILTRI